MLWVRSGPALDQTSHPHGACCCQTHMGRSFVECWGQEGSSLVEWDGRLDSQRNDWATSEQRGQGTQEGPRGYHLPRVRSLCQILILISNWLVLEFVWSDFNFLCIWLIFSEWGFLMPMPINVKPLCIFYYKWLKYSWIFKRWELKCDHKVVCN